MASFHLSIQDPHEAAGTFGLEFWFVEEGTPGCPDTCILGIMANSVFTQGFPDQAVFNWLHTYGEKTGEEVGGEQEQGLS